jgi:adenosylmethionine-8-amino-7-oxononanoate aminotransferase
VENSKNLGKYLFDQLQTLYKHDIVGEIRGGLGLMVNIELMKDRKAKQRFSPDDNSKIGRLLKQKLMSAGLWGMFRNPLPICPSLTITRGEIDEIVRVFDMVIGEVEKEMSA